MLYNEFLEGTQAIDNEASYAEYKRVEQIYMESDHCTKQDAYRMAQVETIQQHEAKMRKARKDELTWVKGNIIGAAAFIRGMSEKKDWNMVSYNYISDCGNLFELKLVRNINGGSFLLYEFFCNGKQIVDEALVSAEFQSYRADWHDKGRKELEDLFGYIA